MKRLTVLLALILLLCGCAAGGGETGPASEPDAIPTASESAGEGLIREPAPETEPAAPAPGQHQAAYSILENDHSIRNENGDILVNIRYDRVILDTAEERWMTINEQILGDYQTFLADMAYLNDTDPRGWEEMLRDMDAVYGNFLAIRSPEVTHNADGIFSIRMTQEWFLGGVYNRDHYGLNFDLATGEALPLSRLSDLPEEEFLVQLKAIVGRALEPNRDALFEDPALILEDYTLEDFSFCIEEGELVLLFPTYTFGPGVLGATEVKTGLYPAIG